MLMLYIRKFLCGRHLRVPHHNSAGVCYVQYTSYTCNTSHLYFLVLTMFNRAWSQNRMQLPASRIELAAERGWLE